MFTNILHYILQYGFVIFISNPARKQGVLRPAFVVWGLLGLACNAIIIERNYRAIGKKCALAHNRLPLMSHHIIHFARVETTLALFYTMHCAQVSPNV
jgi:D-alanyl-lipoteichoic acid acyltransferase DltB (MBOAT superfamily)